MSAAAPRNSGDLVPLAAALVVALAVAWLPGQTHAGALRLIFGCGVLPLLAATRLRRSGWPWVLCWGLLAASALIATPFVPDPGGALRVFAVQLGWVGALALGLSAGERARAMLPWTAAIAGAIAAVPGLVWRGGTFGNADLLAGFLVATALLTLDALRTPRRTTRVAVGVSLAAQLASVVLAGSLGAFAALGVGAAGMAHVQAPLGRRARILAVLSAIAALACVTAASGAAREHLAGRAYVARVAGHVAVSALPLGVGAGQLHGPFLEAQAELLDERPDLAGLWTNAAHAHNEPLHALAEQGPLGLALLLLPLGAALARPRPGAPWAVVLAISALSLVSLPLYEPATAAVTALCVGLVLGRPSRPAPRLARYAALAAATLSLALCSSELLADRLLARGARDHSPAVLSAAAALALRPAPALQMEADALLPDHPLRAALLVEEAVALDPSPRGLVLLGRARLAAGEPHRAIAAFERAAHLHPRLFAAHFDLAQAYEQAGDRHSARRHAERARSLRPSDPRLRWLPK